MINAVIIENDLNSQNYLTSILAEINPSIRIIGNATTANEAITLISKVNPDIIFLDIELDHGTGFDVLKKVDNSNFQVIFITGFNNYHKEALDHFALSYLLKPIDKDKLQQALQRFDDLQSSKKKHNELELFMQYMTSKNQKIFLHVGENYIPIKIEDILYCKSQGNYTEFILEDNSTYEATGIIKHYEKLLEKNSFFRANRSTLVNLKHIKKIHRKETIILTDNTQIPIATRRRQELEEVLKSLI